MTSNKRRYTYLPLILSVTFVAGLLIGHRLFDRGGGTQRYLIYPRTDKVSNVMNYIEEEYVDTINISKISDAGIVAMLTELDPHSVYIPAEDLQAVNEPLEGNFSGIGVQFNMQNDTVVIIQTISNGPSELVGIMPGDRIITVDDSLVAGVDMPSNDIVKMLKGPKGTTVKVGIYRKGEPDLIKFEIIRDQIPLYSVDVAYMITDNIGYVKISSFSRTTFREFLDATDKLKAEGMTKIIVDLRSNGGGYMDAATNIADQFLGKNKLIVYTQGKARPRTDIYATAKGVLHDNEVVILIDEFSASASEILAGAIQDNDRGIIVGRRSFGKGLVQEQIVLSDGSALRLTVARYYTPTGRSIQKPYNNGLEDYYKDIHERVAHGEFVEADSIQFADSLKYYTPGGNIVYGGGGIMPDFFIPVDTTGVTQYFSRLRNRGLIYRYAFHYADSHREKLSEFYKPSELETYLDKQDLLPGLIEFANENGVNPDKKDIDESEELILTQLKAYIARNIMDNEGFYPIIYDVDNTLQKAVDILLGVPDMAARMEYR